MKRLLAVGVTAVLVAALADAIGPGVAQAAGPFRKRIIW